MINGKAHTVKYLCQNVTEPTEAQSKLECDDVFTK